MGTYISVIRHLSVSYKHVICYEKQEDTSKLEKLYSGIKASRRKWKSENETENPSTSYLVIITET